MTKLYIREHKQLGGTQLSDSVPIVYEDGTEIDTVADFTAAAAAHTFDKDTRWVELCPDAGCSYVISPVASAVAATVANFRLPLGALKLVRIPDVINVKGQPAKGLWQISVISNA